MYRAADSQLSVYDFLPPYHGELAADNRWGPAGRHHRLGKL